MSDDLDSYFAAAREAEPGVPGDLLGRVLADAAAHQPKPFTLWRFLGGWKGAPALACGALMGLWIGMGNVTDTASAFTGYDIAATLDSFAEAE
ncbi:hypothetical protein ACMA5I_10160 [Paracoccaceae bacterium GXU_MW_L88]